MRARKFIIRWHAWLTAFAFLTVGAAVAEQPASGPANLPLVEIELAWLADAITFPYSLRAVEEDGMLAIHGTVSSAAIRSQAINVAKVQGAREIIDRMKVASAPPLMTPPPPPERLRADLLGQLRKSVPHLAGSIQIECNADGQAIVTGKVGMLEHKRAVSQALRTVPGCSAIINRLLLPGEPSPAAASTLVRAEFVPARSASSSPPARSADSARMELIAQAIRKACPQARDVQVKQLGTQSFQVHMVAPNDEQGALYANRVFLLDELQRLHLDVLVHVPR